MANISTAGLSSNVEGMLYNVNDDGGYLGIGGLVGVEASGGTWVFVLFLGGESAVHPFLWHDVDGVLK